jgi:hypothetical protein
MTLLSSKRRNEQGSFSGLEFSCLVSRSVFVSLSIPDLFIVGLFMKLGGCSVKWNTGLILGFGSFLEVIMLFGLGYLGLGFCMAEQ